MKIEEIVPPVDLCKLIPTGEFEDSAFQWQETTLKDGSKGIDLIQHYPEKWEHPEWAMLYPAPTVAEIMKKMPYSKLKRTQNTFFFERKHVSGAWSGGYNAAEAALQVYFKLKGIEY